MKTWLVDTGPLVAYLDAGDPQHGKVASCLGAYTGRLVTTGAVLTEAMHFVSADPRGPRRLAELASAIGLEVHHSGGGAELLAAATLMEEYADTPMDYADATLLLLADELKLDRILTLDRRGFSSYRTRKRRALRLVLDEA